MHTTTPSRSQTTPAAAARFCRVAANRTQMTGEPSLGIYAKSPSLQQRQGFSPDSGGGGQYRLERFALQCVVRSVMYSRTSNCLRVRHKTKSGEDARIEVWRSKEFQTAHYKGLQTCGSVWACPVCSAKISERRRVELAAAIATWKAKGGEVLLLTLTNRHDRRDDLAELIKRQAAALQRFMNGSKAAKAWFASMGSVGSIRAMEVTHGDANGWHPHYHMLVFVKSGVQLLETQTAGAKLWANCCRLAGLKAPSIERGLTLQGGEYAARYVGKWGLEQEMTKGHTKKAKAGGASPFDLLRRVLHDSNDSRSAALFREFATVFKGRRQLVWSKDLKARFGIEQLDDEGLAAEVAEGSELFARLSIAQWLAILRHEKRGATSLRGQLLEIASSGDMLQWEMLIESLKPRPDRFIPAARHRRPYDVTSLP